jgi:protein-tyrosine phosphatase
MKIVLFLCSGNYYRSRFAEELFNALAERAGLAWRANSAGLLVDRGTDNLGPVSSNTLCALAQRHIAVAPPLRYPRHVQAFDLAGADRVIALNESEHRLMLDEQFPGWAERVEYWHIPDLGEAPPCVSLGAVERNIEILIQELRDPA